MNGFCKVPVVQTKSLHSRKNKGKIGSRNVFKVPRTDQRRQRASLLERGGESALGRGKVVQRQVLYLGEINDTQHESWCRTIEVFDDKRERTLALALFPADRQLPNFAAGFGVQVRLKEMELHRPRPWGACWLACDLYEQLGLDDFWAECLPD